MTSTNSPRSAANGSPTEEKVHLKGEQFKPSDTKDQEELTNSRDIKLTSNTSSDEVRAPGMFQRVKEEVEAIAESIHEDQLQHRSSGNQGGCFSWFGFGGFHKHNRQSQ